MKTAVVMAGGKGQRLWPLTRRIPKAMVPIDHRPILEFVVAALRQSGFRRILAVLQWKPGHIVEHFGNGSKFGVNMDYLLQDGDWGTAGSVRQALWFLDDDDFLVASSDILFRGDLLGVEEFHRERRSAATIAVSQVEDPSALGLVVRSQEGRVVEFLEKPPAGTARGALVNTGIYFLNRRVLEHLPPRHPADFGHDLFPRLLQEGEPLHAWDLPGYWRDVGSHSDLEAARRDVRTLPGLCNLVTQWPASRRGNGGRIWIHLKAPAGTWLEMDATSIGKAAGIVWQHLSQEEGNTSTLTKLQKLKGIDSKEVLAAIGWLAREGKIQFREEGRNTSVQLAPAEQGAHAH